MELNSPGVQTLPPFSPRPCLPLFRAWSRPNREILRLLRAFPIRLIPMTFPRLMRFSSSWIVRNFLIIPNIVRIILPHRRKTYAS